jgi:hypothetical protein
MNTYKKEEEYERALKDAKKIYQMDKNYKDI